MVVYVSPGIHIEELYETGPAPRETWSPECAGIEFPTIEMSGPGAAVFIGFTERIPADRDGNSLRGKPVALTSWDQYLERFGGVVPGAHLPHAVHGYFANSGRKSYIVSLRTADEAGPRSLEDRLAEFSGEADRRTGLAGLESLDDVSLICGPDLMTGLGPDHMEANAVRACQEAMISFSELKRCMAILDAPRGLTPDDVRQWRQEAIRESSYAALYYPWIYVGAQSPDAQLVPPCGHVAGAYMRASETRGAHSAPANESLTAATDLESRITQREQDVLNPLGINVLRATSDGAIRIWGARTLAKDARLRLVQVRRFLNTVEHSVERGLEWALFRKDDATLRRQIGCAVQEFLTRLWQSGALIGTAQQDAFYIKDDSEDDPRPYPAIEIGMALAKAGQILGDSCRVRFRAGWRR